MLRPKAFVWETYEYLKITKQGSDEIVSLLNELTWEEVEELAPNNHAMTEKFHEIIKDLMLKCFE